ncbi:hypothetical protein BASA83_009336 [Batrachochytrium salamandrivorans]|nr:hypothetical protein BASA83_009336 [Batrachochytrium salamandrivorans]
MKFNVLVAAAMVITRVNAAGKGGFGGLLKKGGGMTGSESSWNLLDKDPESGPSQDAAGDELRPRPSKSPRRKPGASQGRDHTKKKPSDNLEAETPLACNSMASELKDLQKKILGLANSYSNQQLLFDDLAKKMVHWRTTQNGDTSKEYGNDGAKVKNTKRLKNPSAKYDKAEAKLKNTRVSLICWNNSYRRLWSEFTKKCDPTQCPNLMDPKELKKEGDFLVKEEDLSEHMRG